MNITLRTKNLKNGRKSYYLDYTIDGKRTKEWLNLYLIKPSNPVDRELNKETKRLAEQVRAKRQLDLQGTIHGFKSLYKPKTSFLEYFLGVVVERSRSSKVNHENWLSTYKHLEKFTAKELTFEQVDEKFLESLQKYLLSVLSRNSAHTYYNKVNPANPNEASTQTVYSNGVCSLLLPIKFS